MRKNAQSILFAIGFGILFELLTIEAYNCSGIGPATLTMVISTVYYSLITGYQLIHLHGILVPKLWFVSIIALNLALNPLLLYFFCCYFTTILQNSDFLLFYAPVGNTLLFLLDYLLRRHCEREYKQRLPHMESAVSCHRCGKSLTPLTAYCPDCYTISHKLTDTLSVFPGKHHLDFTEDINRRGKYCPHCGAAKGDDRWIDITLASPIRVCVECHHFYLNNSCIEWCFASPPRKFFIISMYLLALPVSLGPLWNALNSSPSIRLGLIFIGIVLLSLGLVIRVLCDNIAESYRRSEANPDYPQLLKFMGYQHLSSPYEESDKKDI